MVIKNLENKIRLVGIICTAFLVGCVIISLSSIWTARTMVSDAQKKVYVLDGNVPILVNRTTMDETLDMEAKSHVEMFHHYFFTLPPDDKYIRYTMEKAMYLVDETGLAQYNTLKEKGFYSNILGTSSVFSIYCDSVAFNKEKMEFTYYGRQRIERRSNILMRELVTAGQLKRVPRTENNPHGLLIVNWRTLLNKDIEQEVSAGRKFAQATRIDKAAAKVQGFANAHRILFLVIVFGFAIGGFTWNIYRITMAYRNSRPTRTATEMQDSVLRERHKRLQGGEIRENRNENKKYEPQ